SSSTSTPTLTGTAEPGSTITVYDTFGGATTALGTTTADGSGAWSFTTPPLANGSHTLTVTARDATGNTSPPSSPLVLTVNSQVPAPLPTPPAGGGSSGTTGNQPPTDIALSIGRVSDHPPAGTVVGSPSTTDPD